MGELYHKIGHGSSDSTVRIVMVHVLRFAVAAGGESPFHKLLPGFRRVSFVVFRHLPDAWAGWIMEFHCICVKNVGPFEGIRSGRLLVNGGDFPGFVIYLLPGRNVKAEYIERNPLAVVFH